MVSTTYTETPREKILQISGDELELSLIQDRRGYGMITIIDEHANQEIERYYALDMALDHVAELFAIRPDQIPLPDEAQSLGL